MKSNYYFDHVSNTLYATKSFLKEAEQFGSAACDVIIQARAMYPDIAIQTYATEKRNNTAIPYKYMVRYISLMPDAAEAIREMESVKLMSHSQKSPFKYVENWFKKKYPEYGKTVRLDTEGNIEAVAEAD